MKQPFIVLTGIALALCAFVHAAEEFDHVLLDPKAEQPGEGWRLNIWGKNPNGSKGSGGVEVVPGRRGGKALRLHTTDTGKHNFIMPSIADGPWRDRQYAAVAVWYRGDGSETKKGFQLQTHTEDGKGQHSYSGNLYLGSTEWKRAVLRSFWRRPSTPDLDMSQLWRILISGTGTHEITIGEIRLLAAGKPVHLTLQGAPQIAQGGLTVREPELVTLRNGLHLCRLIIENDRAAAVDFTVEAAIAPVGSAGDHVSRRQSKVPAGDEATLTIPIPFETKHDGKHRLKLALRGDQGAILAQGEYEFHLRRRAAFDYADIVLWPPPQKWQLRQGHWPLPDRPTLSVAGQGDAFPSGHLADRLKRVYGVEVQRGTGPTAHLRLQYVKQGVKPEGFVLDVGTDGVNLRAGDGRGMYYGVRALLDLMCQSSMGETDAQCRRVHCEDWPACPTRVVYHRIDDYYQVSKGVQTYKDFIYDQVAGGRYNLLILNCRGGVRYDSHPELSRRSAFKKPELREILDFARKHYVNVAPGGNSPGHAGWLVLPHQELREDGDPKTLCTRHPDALPLLRDVYGELIDLFQPTRYFHLGGDEVRWKTRSIPAEKHCPRCKGVAKSALLLEHWTALIEFCRSKGVKPILWEDMLSPTWNGGEPFQTARLLPQIQEGTIVASWGTGALVNPTKRYRDLGLTPWKVNTSYAPSKMESFPSWWRDYDALGIAEFMPWPWCNFIHYYAEKILYYTTPALHCCAACNWNPEIAALSWHELVAGQGLHWMKVMQASEWGTRRIRYKPIAMAAACNESGLDQAKGDGKGWLDLGPERDLRALPNGRFLVGATPFERPPRPADCVVLRGAAASAPIKIGRPVRGLVFLHTAAASKQDVAKLAKRFFRKNTSHYGMVIASYRVQYADGEEVAVPVKLGWNIHLWDCYPAARIMPGARAFWTNPTQAGQGPGACAWTMEWKNPKPDAPVDSVIFAAEDTEATVALLGITAVD